MNRPITVFTILIFFGIFFVWIAFTFEGTGDAGDSLTHYQFARYAFAHPANFLDSWGKPVFILIAAPFAQAGFVGIKLFNIMLALLTAFLLHRTLLKMGEELAWLSLFFLFAAPLYFILMFSGFTEYLFACLLTLSIFLFVSKRFWAAAFLISFLPFVRAEGLLILPCIFLYLLVKRKWFVISALFAGHIVYGIIGLIVKSDFLWMFHENPYVSYSDQYGRGNWMHFLNQLNYVIGVPLYILSAIGVLTLIVRLCLNKPLNSNYNAERYLLFAMSFFVFLAAHIIFWKFGLFHSMGLKRVLISVLPMLIFIIIDGLGFLKSIMKNRMKKIHTISISVFLLVVLIFPFTSNPAAVNVEKDLKLQKSQQQMARFVSELNSEFPDIHQRKIFCSHPYLRILLDLDPFDSNACESIKTISADKTIADSSLIIWDCEFCEKEDGVALDILKNDTRLILHKSLPTGDEKSDCFFVFMLKK